MPVDPDLPEHHSPPEASDLAVGAEPLPEGTRILALRYAGQCRRCGRALSKGSTASWDRSSRTVTCLACVAVVPERDGGDVIEASEPAASRAGPAHLTTSAGASAEREYQRRHQRRAQRLDARWGRLAPVVDALTSDPQSTTAWAKGADGERRVASHLGRVLGGGVVMLHDRRAPGRHSNIDHIAISANGVWVIDAKNYRGRVERRNVGGWFRADEQLYVDGRRRGTLVEGVQQQTMLVRAALAPHEVPLHGALCFTNATWGLLAKPFRIGEVWVVWADALAKLIAAPGEGSAAEVAAIARRLDEVLRPA